MRFPRIIAVAGLTAMLLVSSACKPGAATGTANEAGTGPLAGSSAGSGAGGPGTITVAITQPVAVSGHAGTSVSCDTGRIYTSTTQSVVIQGYQLSFTVRAAGYRGPGSYPALVTLRLDGSNGAVTTLSGVPNVDAAITDAGGSFTIHATGDNGKTLDGSLQWICS